MRCHGEVERLDGALASFARAEAGLRLRLGQVLEVLGRGKHFELGFSSIAAYALERCDRSVRWVEAARCLARRLEPLPELRRAVAFGSVSWSMGELLARVAQPGDEARWIEAAESRTVREMRGLVEAAVHERAVGAILNGRAGGGSVLGEQASDEQASDEQAAARTASASENGEAGGDDEVCTLTCTVDREDAWLFEATRTLLEQLGEHGADAQVEALLAEGQGTLLAALPAGALDLDRWGGVDTAQHRWLQELGRWRAAAEALCEKNFRDSVLGSGRDFDRNVDLNGDPKAADPVRSAVAEAAALGLSALEGAGCHDLDGMLRGLSRLLARHELELSRLVLQFHRADGWRRLGYASEAQYARERLGLSRSSLLARRALALRLEKLPRVAEALGAGQIGVEAAVQVVRVAVPSTQAAWVERARQRTLKHLREEVAAALVAVRLSGEAELPAAGGWRDGRVSRAGAGRREWTGVSTAPANDSANDSEVAHDTEARGVGVTGLTEPTSEERRAWLVMLGSLARWLESGVQVSAGARHGDRVEGHLERRAGRAPLASVAGQLRPLAWARSTGAALATERHELAAVFVPVALERLAPSSGHERRVWADLHPRSLPVQQPGVQPAGRHAPSSPVPLGGRK